MTASTDKEIQQMNNILQTLIEATEHFHSLIKNKELHQSIFIFSSIVEGIEAINNISQNREWNTQKDKTEKDLLEIAKLIEKGNLTKISEILQFSFLPHLRKVSHYFSQKVKNLVQERIYTIGVFNSFGNPRKLYTKERVNAMVAESDRQKVKLLFFTSNNVNFENQEITADICINGEWERITVPFPDVINNVGGGKQSLVERKLRRKIPFTSFYVGDKYSLPKRMIKYRQFSELLVPFKVCNKEKSIHEFIEKNNKVVFKYLLSNRGENIYFVTKKGTRYVLLEHKKERILSYESFSEWLQSIILREEDSFIIQKYIHTRTKNDEPYHFRAHVQKDGQGKWVLTHIYPRVGNKKSNLSNVATDGYVGDFHNFLMSEYGENGKEHEKNILKLSIDIAHHLDKLYGLSLDELGIDLAIDEKEQYWMHEANNGPQTAYHEEKRAVNTIAYAKYIAENGIFHSDYTRKTIAGMFQSRTANLSFKKLNSNLSIGILTGKIVNDSLASTLGKIAEQRDINLYSFTPKDIDYDEMLIRGYFYKNGDWTPKIVEYPDVIFDHLRLRNNQNARWIYEELDEIPFINRWENNQHTRSEIYNLINETKDLMPFQKVTRTRDIFHYIEKYNNVLIKPEFGNIINKQYIKHCQNGKYEVIKGGSIKKYNELQLLNKLKDLIKGTKFIVQKDAYNIDRNGQPFSIHAHLMRGKGEKWKIVNLYSEILDSSSDSNKVNNQQEELNIFLQSHYGEQEIENIENNIINKCESTANKLQESYGDMISEVAIELGIDASQQLTLIEVNPDGPTSFYQPDNYADSILEYAAILKAQDKEKQLDIEK